MLKPAKLVKGYILQIVIKSVIKITMYKLTQVYSRYPCEKPLMERVFVRTG